MLRAALVALLLGPATAIAGSSGGGVTLHNARIDQGVPCIGGVGYRAERTRLGGEGSVCAGGGSGMGFGGAQVGWQSRTRLVYTAAYSGIGAGWAKFGRDDADVHMAFMYARPALALGVPLAFGAVEGSLFGMLPLPVYQRVEAGASARGAFPQVGVQLTLLFGDFRRERKGPVVVAPPPPPQTTVVVVQPPPPPRVVSVVPAPIQPDDLAPPVPRPLAIPADPPPPPPLE